MIELSFKGMSLCKVFGGFAMEIAEQYNCCAFHQ